MKRAILLLAAVLIVATSAVGLVSRGHPAFAQAGSTHFGPILNLTIEMEAHGTHAFGAGEALAEGVNTWHNGRNLRDQPVRFLIVFAAQERTPVIVRL
jgi:hypothetical protein